MAVIIRGHHRYYATSRLVGNIVFDKEFANLCEELSLLYKKYDHTGNPEQEAFQDALYSFLTQKKAGVRAFSL